MQHRGHIVEEAVRNSGFSITKLANKLGKSRRWVYLAFEDPFLKLDHILKIGKLINHDFSEEIEEFKNISESVTYEAGVMYKKNDKDVAYWKNKYYELLEDYHQMMKKFQNFDRK